MGLLNWLFKSGRKIDAPSIVHEKNCTQSEKLKRSFDFLSASSGEQAAAVHETMASIEQIRTMLAQTDQHINRSLGLAGRATSLGESQRDTVSKMQNAMKAIKESNQLLKDLQSSLLAIKNKTRVINDIVIKTQLLSFNASIEAARAGQYGKGFAVVAEEVGRLAQTSGRAAKEIESLINESQQRANTVVTQVISRAEEGIDVATEVIDGFGEMTDLISQISTGLNAMTQASREQLQGMEQTTIAIEKISKVSEENRRNAGDVMALADLSGANISSAEADELKSLVEHFSHGQIKPRSSPGITEIGADDSTFNPQS